MTGVLRFANKKALLKKEESLELRKIRITNR
jgi:hypothetical protein